MHPTQHDFALLHNERKRSPEHRSSLPIYFPFLNILARPGGERQPPLINIKITRPMI